MQLFERDLADVFRHRADGVPASSVARVCETDYHPRTRRVTPLVTGSAIAGAVATTATVATVVSVVGAPAAFAGWKAAPGTGTAPVSSSALATCSSQLGPPRSSIPGATRATTSTPWNEVATDVRGPYTLVVYDGSKGDSEATCLTSATFTSVWEGSRFATHVSTWVGSASTGSSDRTFTVGVLSATVFGGLAPVTEVHDTAAGQGAYTLVEGEVPGTVTAVTLVRSDGAAVQASTADGWFVAWWPGSAGATSAALTSPAGTTSKQLAFVAPGAPDPSRPVQCSPTAGQAVCSAGSTATPATAADATSATTTDATSATSAGN